MKIFFAGIFVCLSQSGFTQIPANGLIGGWIFNGNANDISGNNNHGSVYNASLTTDRFGNINSAYSFNGFNSYIEMQSGGPQANAARTVCFWERTSSNAVMASFDYGTLSNGGVFHIVLNYSCSGIGIDVSNQALIWGNNSLVNNTWHHIAAVFNPTVGSQINNIVFYVDGVVQQNPLCYVTGSTSIVNTGNVNPVIVGKTAGVSSRYFNGDLDDYYLYDRALSQQEILNIYNYMPCVLPTIPGPIVGDQLICSGAAQVYSIGVVSGATSYSWSLPLSWSGSSSTNTIVVFPGTNSGLMSVTVSNTCGTSAQKTLSVTTVGAIPQISVSSSDSLACAGSIVTLGANGAFTYTWQPGNLTGFLVNITPTVTTTYTVTGKSQSGCFGTNVFIQNVEICNHIFESQEIMQVGLPFPNPGSEELTIISLIETEILITDENGKQVLKEKLLKGNNKLSVHELCAGVYSIKPCRQEGHKILKFIKQ